MDYHTIYYFSLEKLAFALKWTPTKLLSASFGIVLLGFFWRSVFLTLTEQAKWPSQCLMVVIINGYVALSDLNSGFIYIVAVNLGACAVWGIIDGLIYAVSSSIERNNVRNKLLRLKSVQGKNILNVMKNSLDGTFLAGFDEEGKEAIAKDIVVHVPHASVGESKVITRNEAMGWLSIIGIYLVVGFLLALPFLVLHDRV